MHRLVIAVVSLIVAIIWMGGCEPFDEPHLTLHALCESGDATPERIQAFLDLGVDVNTSDEKGWTPLDRTAANWTRFPGRPCTMLALDPNDGAHFIYSQPPLYDALKAGHERPKEGSKPDLSIVF